MPREALVLELVEEQRPTIDQPSTSHRQGLSVLLGRWSGGRQADGRLVDGRLVDDRWSVGR